MGIFTTLIIAIVAYEVGKARAYFAVKGTFPYPIIE